MEKKINEGGGGRSKTKMKEWGKSKKIPGPPHPQIFTWNCPKEITLVKCMIRTVYIDYILLNQFTNESSRLHYIIGLLSLLLLLN